MILERSIYEKENNKNRTPQKTSESSNEYIMPREIKLKNKSRASSKPPLKDNFIKTWDDDQYERIDSLESFNPQYTYVTKPPINIINNENFKTPIKPYTRLDNSMQ